MRVALGYERALGRLDVIAQLRPKDIERSERTTKRPSAAACVMPRSAFKDCIEVTSQTLLEAVLATNAVLIE